MPLVLVEVPDRAVMKLKPSLPPRKVSNMRMFPV